MACGGLRQCAAAWLLAAFVAAERGAAEDGPIVNTTCGRVQGLAARYDDGRRYDVFLGIPFAAPPIGAERWKRPQEARSWTGVRQAVKFGKYCTQIISPLYGLIGMSVRDSEDCLFVNVYVPEGVKSAENLPVMVWIYGGAYRTGLSDMYPLEDLALNGKVVAVSLNYRTGTLGFASTEDKYSEGNYGLYDQIAALQWVQKNIRAFGGDPSRVTIFGQSAGGASVSHLSLSPVAKGMFHRVLAISGSAASYFATGDWHEKITRELATANLCFNFLSHKRTMRCLRKRNAKILELTGVSAPLLSRHNPGWVPRVDGQLVAMEPRAAMEQGHARDYDLLLGHMHDDGAFLVYLNPVGLWYGNLLNVCKHPRLLKLLMHYVMRRYDNPDELVDLVYAQYPDLTHRDLEVRSKTAVLLITDFLFASPAVLEAEAHSKAAAACNKTTFLYRFSYRQSFLQYEPWVNGSHIDDLYSVLGPPFLRTFRQRFLRRPYSQDDDKVKNIVQKYYSNFAYTGNPNKGPHDVDLEWPEFSAQDRKYLQFSLFPQILHQDEALLARISFWNEKFYHTAKRHHDTEGAPMIDIQAVSDLAKLINNAIEEFSKVDKFEENGGYIEKLLATFRDFMNLDMEPVAKNKNISDEIY